MNPSTAVGIIAALSLAGAAFRAVAVNADIDRRIGIFNVLHPPISPEGQQVVDMAESILKGDRT